MKASTSMVFVLIVTVAILLIILAFQFGIFSYLSQGLGNFLQMSNHTITSSAEKIINATQ